MKEIFIVEDDTDIRELIVMLLSQEYKVQSFPTAETFNREIEHHKPDLILLDIMLPDGNGADMCLKLKEEKNTSAIPIILMSAHVDPKITRRNCGDDFISKPFDIDEFAGKIKRQLT